LALNFKSTAIFQINYQFILAKPQHITDFLTTGFSRGYFLYEGQFALLIFIQN
jgi:hypothetical protein